MDGLSSLSSGDMQAESERPVREIGESTEPHVCLWAEEETVQRMWRHHRVRSQGAWWRLWREAELSLDAEDAL